MRGLVGNLHDADVYVCGPSDFTDEIVATARRLGARVDRIHLETFSF
jgi:ferredoxin-NADP reductase